MEGGGSEERFGTATDRALLLEEVFEGLARVVVAGRRGRRGGGRFLGIRRRSRVLFHRGAKFVERAIVFGVFGRDALRNGLRALKLRAGIEEAALLAAVQFELAFGAFAVGIEAGGEDRAAVGAAGAGYGADHARGARAELIGARAALRGLAVVTMAARLSFLSFFSASRYPR